ncbi:hypothetical protein COCOR_03631 [Corallococcus coralloides DSM 2259]|uniref:Lipoprotein n=1 Tax=Corallococcus coralloides (strain ATCC 25202 / DSM 2259 / NBRC 100086 / M2) TaxID=1144275 RepID=H8MNB7_CORCM|nr:hypothetical protein [Corallococcus coralloides]AFE05343.1 hypothetical protein COCOR_03631 [Corallococcus coralloides DSM 2259]
MKVVSFAAAAGLALSMLVGCGGVEDVAQSDEGTQPVLGSTEQHARQNGDWCYATCNNRFVYAGPNVTQNCTEWGQMVCSHRGTSLWYAQWAAPYGAASCYLYGDGDCY